MQLYTKTHQHYCGIDLHARTMYLCIISHEGEIVLHRNMKCSATNLLRAIKPYRDDLVICVECLFCWYWMADLCDQESIAFVLGHAYYMKAIHGGKAKSDKIDSRKIAMLLRGGNLPYGYAYPAKMRAARDLLRRRLKLARLRADTMAHIRNTVSQYNLPPLAVRLGRLKDRREVATHFSDPIVRRMIQLDLDQITFIDQQLYALERELEHLVLDHNPIAYQLITSIRGIGRILGLVLVYEIEDISRFATPQRFASYARLVKCKSESAGKTYGTKGNKIGSAYLKWAFSEAAVLFLRGNKPAQKAIERLACKHGKGKALSILSHKLGRAVYSMLRNHVAFDEQRLIDSLV